MKRKLFLLMGLVVAVGSLAGVSAAASAQTPSPTIRGQGLAPTGAVTVSAPPAYCNPCLFYSGDFSPLDPNANGLANENDLFVSTSRVYAAVRPDRDWYVTDVFVNVLSSSSVLDPTLTPWDIRTGVSAGNGGTDYRFGASAAAYAPTGRSAFGFTEYTVRVHLSTEALLRAGVTYYVNVMPQCTNAGNPMCNTRYFGSNVEPVGAPINHVGPPNVNGNSFFNSAFFGANYVPATDEGGGFQQFSFGLIGHPKLYKV